MKPKFEVKGTRILLREQCNLRGWTQGELAKAWGISRQNLANRIRRPTRNLAYDLAIEFDLPLKEVVAKMSGK